jgi:hypothetical protein
VSDLLWCDKVAWLSSSPQCLFGRMWTDSFVVTEEKLLDAITKMDERIATAKVQMGDRDKTKDVALGTSK